MRQNGWLILLDGDKHCENAKSVNEGLLHVHWVSAVEDLKELCIKLRNHLEIFVVWIFNEITEETGCVKKFALWDRFVVVQIQSEEVKEVGFNYRGYVLFEVKDQLTTDFHHIGRCSTNLSQSFLKGLFILFIKVNVLVVNSWQGLFLCICN
jgi:hypothetical protein